MGWGHTLDRPPLLAQCKTLGTVSNLSARKTPVSGDPMLTQTPTADACYTRAANLLIQAEMGSRAQKKQRHSPAWPTHWITSAPTCRSE